MRRKRIITSPNTDAMHGLAIPDPIISGKYLYRYYRSKSIRDKKLRDYPGAKLIEPKWARRTIANVDGQIIGRS